MAYLLDANVFIQAKNLHYGFDFCPAFWAWIEVKNAAGAVFSIEKVADEIEAHTDELTAWAARQGDRLFLPPDDSVLAAFPRVGTWVRGRGYTGPAMDTFFHVADYYLVAHALAHSHIVVTHEIPGKKGMRKVQIPDVCIGLRIKCITPFDMLRKEKARFVLLAGSA